MKYELTDDTISLYGHTLHRIKALKDIPSRGVRIGDLGGYVESVNNLSQDGNAWVYGSAQVFGNAYVYGNAQVYDIAWVFGNARVYGDARMNGCARVFGYTRVSGDTNPKESVKSERKKKNSDWLA